MGLDGVDWGRGVGWVGGGRMDDRARTQEEWLLWVSGTWGVLEVGYGDRMDGDGDGDVCM